jgi:3-deoxy-D-manno-octulosonic-acid transferase
MVHGVSVGEINAARPFIEVLHRRDPHCEILVTASTQTGYSRARASIRDCRIDYFPLDFFWTVRRFLDRYRPKRIFILETELWPNFTAEAARRGIPVYLVNARISDRSYPRYRRIRFFLQTVFPHFRFFFSQSEIDASRLHALGVPRTKLLVTGSMKFDAAVANARGGKNRPAPIHFPSDDQARVFLAGSTRERENRMCLDIFLYLKKQFPGLRFILAPRKPDTLKPTAAFLRRMNIPFTLRSLQESDTVSTDILLIDTLGELFSFYSLADVIFIGKSLVRPGGGQNPLEPAVLGKPVLMGPAYENFRDIVDSMQSARAIRIVSDPDALRSALIEWLKHPELAAATGRNAREFVYGRPSTAQTVLERVALLEPDARVA